MLNKKGFTLVELLVVVVILAILFLIAVVRIPQTLTRAREAKTKDNLANLRVAINNYYSANPGFYPRDLDNKADILNDQLIPAFIPDYMPEIPKARLRTNLGSTNSHTNNVTIIDTGTNMMVEDDITDIGGWIYSSTTGEIRINCKKKDSKEKMYYSSYGHEE